MRVLPCRTTWFGTHSLSVRRTRYNQIDSNLANLDATVKGGGVIFGVSLIAHWQHV